MNQAVEWPDRIVQGFNFDEAITMAELCRRVYRIFDEGQDTDEARELYEAVYYRDEWEFVHAICDFDTDGRCLIVKHQTRNQYAIIFRGTVFTGEGVDFSNAAADVDLNLIEYDPIPGEAAPPPRAARVHQGFAHAYKAFEDEIHFFFNILTHSRLEQRLLTDLIEVDRQERNSRIAAIGAAIGARYGREVGQRSVRNMTRVVHQISEGELSADSVSFDALIEKGVRFHRVLAELVGDGDGGSEVASDQPLEVYLAGHSLGGALATLCILDLKRYLSSRQDFPDFSLKGYSIGSPKVGNHEFAEYFDSQLAGFNHRIQNPLDPVVHIPFLLLLLTTVPFPYNLQLLVPGVKYIKAGDEFYDRFGHVGESYTVFGLGSQKLEISFGGPFKVALPLPFPHGPDGYQSMLIAARGREARMWKPTQRLAKTLLRDQREQVTGLEKQLAEVRQALERIELKQEDTIAPPALPAQTAKTMDL